MMSLVVVIEMERDQTKVGGVALQMAFIRGVKTVLIRHRRRKTKIGIVVEDAGVIWDVFGKIGEMRDYFVPEAVSIGTIDDKELREEEAKIEERIRALVGG